MVGRVALLLLLLPLAGLAGCLEAGVPDGPGGSDVGCCGPPEGDPFDGDPVAIEEFQPDTMRLKRDFCANHTIELPAPRFGLLRLSGTEDRLYEGPMPCTIILDPASTDQQRNESSVYVDFLDVSSAGTAFTVDSYSGGLLSNLTLYGSVEFVAPAGDWGPQGRYGVGWDPREQDGRIVTTLAKLTHAPRG